LLKIEVIDSSRFLTTEWSGGMTTQLFISPEGASYAERRFRYRISTAVVELEESVFTRLEGVTRFLTPLCEKGFGLTINGAPELTLQKGKVLEFSGEDDIICRGCGRDLNLMLKNAKGAMSCIGAGEEFALPCDSDCFIYSSEQTAISAHCGGGVSVVLPEGGFARLCADEGDDIRLCTSGALVLFAVYRY